MNPRAVIYCSKHGSTKQIAKMIADKYNLPLINIMHINGYSFQEVPVIFCGWIKKGKIQGLFSLVYHFPEGYDLLDRVLVRAHGVIHFLYGGKHGLVELPDRLVQLGFRQPGSCIFWVPWKKFHVR